MPEGFQDIAKRRICYAHIDVDRFQPTRDALGLVYTRMVTCGVIVCDDYRLNTRPGAQCALDEFFASRTQPVVHRPAGQGIVFTDPAAARQE